MERFVGKSAVITGASGGIGAAITKELLKLNVNVIGLDVDIEKLKLLEEDLSKNTQIYTGKFYPRKCDVSDEEEVQTTFQWIDKYHKTMSILINGAGIYTVPAQDLQNITAKVFDSTFGVNSKGTLLCAREAMNLMVKNSEAGHIINICSIAGYDSFYHAANRIYAASKHVVRLFSDSMKREIARKRANIKVTNLSPGSTKTNIAMRDNKSVYHDNPLVEVLEPEDIAKGCMSILSTPEHVLISEIVIEPIYQLLK